MNSKQLSLLYADHKKCAKFLNLNYTVAEELNDHLHREKKGKGFAYKYANGKWLEDEDKKDWINKLKIPPNLSEVRISKDEDSHLLAVGLDSAGRLQYFYHPKWIHARKIFNFYKVILVGRNIQKIRKHYKKDLQNSDLNLDKACALAVGIIDKTLIRNGSDQYAKENESFGVTTLRKKHVSVNNKKDEVTLNFVGKSHVEQEIETHDKLIVNTIEEMYNTPGYELLKFFDDEGNKRDLKAVHVNDYLKTITNENITAKDFRTWGAYVVFTQSLLDQNIMDNTIVDLVAEKLGNTKQVSKNYYIHPELLDENNHESLISILGENAESTLELDQTKLSNKLCDFLESTMKDELSSINLQ